MNTGQTNVEHNLRIIDGVIDEMAGIFYRNRKESAGGEPSKETDEHLGMIAGKLGYLVNISIGATKTWNYEERIAKLETEKDNPIPESVRKEYQFNPDIMLTVVRDDRGRLMN